MTRTDSRRRRALRGAVYVLAFAALPAVTGVISVRRTMRDLRAALPAPAVAALPEPPAHDSARPTAVVLLGNGPTESSDFLAPYELLARSGIYNVYAVAPERRPAPLFPGGLDVLPHFSFDDYDRVVGAPPAILVLPYIPGSGAGLDERIPAWLRRMRGPETLLLTICGGSMTAADAGLLTGHAATSHHAVLPIVRRNHADVRWIDGLRYVDDGNVVTSAGITSGIDATLHVLARLHGRAVAERIANDVGYPHLRFLDDPAYRPEAAGMVLSTLRAAWGRTDAVGVFLGHGATEIELASIIDTYPRTYTTRLRTLAARREYVRSLHGLDLLPRVALSGDSPRRILTTGTLTVTDETALREWLSAGNRSAVAARSGDAFPYDAALLDLAQRESIGTAADAARGLEYPLEALRHAGMPSVAGPLMRAFALGLLGLGVALGIRRLMLRGTSPGA